MMGENCLMVRLSQTDRFPLCFEAGSIYCVFQGFFVSLVVY